jgi:soluble lytic murein transglycosylase-like protein
MTQDSKKNRAFVLISLLIVFVLIVCVAAAYRYIGFEPEAPDSRIKHLEKSLQDIRSAMNIDSVRQFNIQKIMAIIDRYNPDIPSGVKYEIAEEIYNMSLKYTNLDVDLICATITFETASTWNHELVSESGAMGLMQIMPTSGFLLAYYEGITWTSSEEILFDPIYNIRIGCRFLSVLIKQYDLEGGLAAYNGGEKRAALWLASDKAEGILLAETSNYIPEVLSLYEAFKGITL